MKTQSFTKRSFMVSAIFILLLVVLPVTTALAATSGANNAGTGSNVAGTGTVDWSGPGNIIAVDTSYATADLSGTGLFTSRYLEGTNYGFAIPSAATIDGIQVSIGRFENQQGPQNDVRDTVVRLIKNGNITGDNKADTGTDWPTTNTAATYGSTSDLWGVSWTPEDINASNFGVALAVNSDSNRVASVDYMQITVTYTVHTTTNVDCGAGNPVVQYGSSISCVATVTGASGSDTPSGIVTWGTNDSGSFGTSACVQDTGLGTLTCTAVYTPSAVGDGSHNVTATYAGDINFKDSSGNRDVTVTTIALVPSITANSKVYDGTNAATIATYSLSSAVAAGDDVNLTGGTATFDEKNVGNVKTVTGSGFSLSGAQAGNYHLFPTTATTTANITPAGLSVGGSLIANNKVYDGTTAATLSGTAVLSGTVFGADTVALDGTPSASFADKNVGTGKPVSVTGYSLSGLDASNYAISQPSGLSANITAKGLIITADNKSKVVGNPDPVFTFTPSGLVGSDSFVTAPTCDVPAAHTLPGTYDIVCSGGDAGANYTISNYVNGTLTVNAVNNAPTDIALSPSNVDENRPVGTVVGALSTSDPDAGDTFTYALVTDVVNCPAVTDNAFFSVSGSNLRTAAIFDYETKSSYSICVRSTDSGASSFTKPFTVTVNNKIDTASFTDVPTSYWAWAYIESIYAAGITGGCTSSPLAYCPSGDVTRAQMAVFILKGIHGTGYTPPAATGTVFADVPATHWAAAWIEQFASEGITGGCGGGNYCPDVSVTRAQMAVFLLRAKHTSAYTPPAAAGTVFADVPTGHWAGAWIEQLAAEAITGGCGGGNYCPDSSVTRDQMAIFLQKTFNLALP